MARMIDADAFRASICESCLKHGGVCYARPDIDGYECSRVMPIDRAPTIDAEPVRHGRWVTKPNPQWPAHNEQHCSICGWHIHKSKLRNSDKWSYCPNCGAKMNGGAGCGPA